MNPVYFEYYVAAVPGDELTSEVKVVSGLDTTSTLAIENGLCRVNGGAWADTALIDNDDEIELFGEAPKEYGKSVRVRYSVLETGFEAYWKISTAVDPENVASDLGILPAFDKAISTVVTSNTIVVKGFNRRSLPIAAYDDPITGPTGLELSVNGGTWITEGTIHPGQTLQLRATSSSALATTLVFDFTIGTNFFSWQITTEADNPTYPFFYFPTLVLQPLSTAGGLIVRESPPVEISGLSEPLEVTVKGNSVGGDPFSVTGDPTFSINDGGLVTQGTIDNGDIIRLAAYPSGLDRKSRLVTLYPLAESPTPVNSLGSWVLRTEAHALDNVADLITIAPSLNLPPGIELDSPIITPTGFDTDVVIESDSPDVWFRIRTNELSDWSEWSQGWSLFAGTELQIRALTPATVNQIRDVVIRLNGVPIVWRVGSRTRLIRTNPHRT